MTKRSIHCILLTLLIAAVALEGVLLVLPHDHATVSVSLDQCDSHDCSAPSCSHIKSDEELGAHAPCLACASHGLAFSIEVAGAKIVVAEGSRQTASTTEIIDAIPHRWHHPFRGPPATT